MRTTAICLTLCLFAVYCKKDQTGSPSSSGTDQNGMSTPKQLTDSSFINVAINDIPMKVTAIHYSRGGSALNLSAENALEKVDVYCFRFSGQSGLNFQYSDSINYSTRADGLAKWSTRRAGNWGNVDFDCCAFPLTAPVVKGIFSGNFGDYKYPILITGNFKLKF